MKSKIKKPLVLIIMLILLAATLTACQFGITLEGEKEQYGLTAKITYHLNGGTQVDNSDHLDMYYKTGDVAIDLGFDEMTKGTINVQRNNYSLVGWFYPATKEDGSIDYVDEEKGIVNVDKNRAFDFKTYRVAEGDEIDLYAYWLPNQKLEFVLANEETLNNQVVVGETTYLAGGAPLKVEEFGRDTYINKSMYDPLYGNVNYTFVGYYEDVDCTTPVKWPVERTNEETNIKVYAKYLPGDWTVIETVMDLKEVVGKYVNKGKYYINNDIIANGYVIEISENATFNGTIRGNGHTISGITFKKASIKNGSYVSMFGTIGENAVIKDITFKDCKGDFAANKDCSISAYFFADDIYNAAVLSNVKIDGGELIVDARSGEWKNASEICPIYRGEAGREGIEVVNAPTVNEI